MSEKNDRCFGFERLDVWRKAVDFAKSVYCITGGFPREEMFGLCNQLRRAAVSVAANIAEGASRSSGKDQARYFEIAYGSLNEIMTMLHIALAERFVENAQFDQARYDIAVMPRMLSGLKRRALDRVPSSLNTKHSTLNTAEDRP